MRKYTLLFSIVVHAAAGCAVLFTTVLATDELPVPRDGSTFVNVVTAPPPVPPVAPRLRAEPVVASSAAPFEAPEGVRPDAERPVLDDIGDTSPVDAVGGFGSDPGIVIRDESPPPPPPPSPPVRVGGVIKPPTRTFVVTPEYPAIARSAHVGGTVILEATIGEDGSVRDLRVLRSIPLLDDAAGKAVRQWRFTPTLLNGQAVSVLMTVTVTFNLE